MSEIITRKIDYATDPWAEEAARLIHTEIAGVRLLPNVRYAPEIAEDQADWHNLVTVAEHPRPAVLALGSLQITGSTYGTGFLQNIVVRKEFQKMGFGKNIVRCLENTAKATGVNMLTLDALPSAIPFYEGLGYEKIGRDFGMYMMSKTIDLSPDS